MASGSRNQYDDNEESKSYSTVTPGQSVPLNAIQVQSNLSEDGAKKRDKGPKDGATLIDKGVNETVNEVNELDEIILEYFNIGHGRGSPLEFCLSHAKVDWKKNPVTFEGF